MFGCGPCGDSPSQHGKNSYRAQNDGNQQCLNKFLRTTAIQEQGISSREHRFFPLDDK
jgi:hypothetical protein